MNRRRFAARWPVVLGYFLLELLIDILRIVSFVVILAMAIAAPCVIGKASDMLMGGPWDRLEVSLVNEIAGLWVIGATSIAAAMVLVGWLASCWKRANEND